MHLSGSVPMDTPTLALTLIAALTMFASGAGRGRSPPG